MSVDLKKEERSRLSLGKLPPEVMERYLFGMTGARSRRVVVEPSLGLDFGVVRLGGERSKGRYLIVSSDPITGVRERAGWYAVNVSANDVATSGNRPEFMQSVILLPEDASERDVRRLSSDMHRTAKGLGIAIVGGHTELSPGLHRPIVVTTAFAVADSYVTAAGAREGDTLMMTKTAGVEGTAILGTDARFNKRLDRRTVSGAARLLREAQRGGRGRGRLPDGGRPRDARLHGGRGARAPCTRWRLPRGWASRSRRRTSRSRERRGGSALRSGWTR